MPAKAEFPAWLVRNCNDPAATYMKYHETPDGQCDVVITDLEQYKAARALMDTRKKPNQVKERGSRDRSNEVALEPFNVYQFETITKNSSGGRWVKDAVRQYHHDRVNPALTEEAAGQELHRKATKANSNATKPARRAKERAQKQQMQNKRAIEVAGELL